MDAAAHQGKTVAIDVPMTFEYAVPVCVVSLLSRAHTHSLDGHKHKNQFFGLTKTIRIRRNSGAHTVFV